MTQPTRDRTPTMWEKDRPTMTAPTCNRTKDRHIYWVHDGEGWDRCLCGRDEVECAGVEECGLADFSWLPRRGGDD
jgi:hypothetical protein